MFGIKEGREGRRHGWEKARRGLDGRLVDRMTILSAVLTLASQAVSPGCRDNGDGC